jgi:hypothetical protein
MSLPVKTAGSRERRITTSKANRDIPVQLVTCVAELPALAMHFWADHLDPLTLRTLRHVDHSCKESIDLQLQLVQVSLDHLKHHEMSQLAEQYAQASCFVLRAPQVS